ncbi:rod shape-determining protein MreC [Rubidibacter lacunae KORDI 51-2]|uniref:Cell shape-determining protein MreC n=1 Tax=Rubidibacter lacunae KORDI 51-2 TaxID=582515 RepID=U5DNX6_9CHRO|nr:rod shape-determining protein MreC [Rubidibacter lacunae]ERN42309.1 rod shape-determining protein MreC [Rubidibacter lacunae KORDI 51-2]
MAATRGWWSRHGSQTILVGLLLAASWVVRQTNAAPLYELYRWLSHPLQDAPSPEAVRADARVLELQARLGELKRQNQQLKDLLDYRESQDAEAIAALAIGRSADRWYEQIVLGIGSARGIRVGAAVSAEGGLIGRVTNVTPNTARVLLISDPSSRVGVTISRSRQLGFIRGQGSNLAVMQFFEKTPDVQPGDVVVTSAVSRRFPAGVPVGHVRSLDLEKSPAPEAVVELSAPFDYLEWAFVQAHSVPNLGDDE